MTAVVKYNRQARNGVGWPVYDIGPSNRLKEVSFDYQVTYQWVNNLSFLKKCFNAGGKILSTWQSPF